MTASSRLPLEIVSANGHDLDSVSTQRNFDAISQSWPITPGVPVTSLSGISAFDGQEVYVLADATNGVMWRLRYRAAAPSAYKWEFVGGSNYTSAIAGNITTASTVFVAMTTGPTLTLPLAGVYEVTFNCFMQQQVAGANNMLADIAVNGVDSTFGVIFVGVAQFNGAEVERTFQVTAASASAVLSVLVKTPNALSTTFNNAQIMVRPLRVG